MVKKGGRKSGGAIINNINKSVKKVNNSLKDPENLIIAVLSIVLLVLVVYYLRLSSVDGNDTQEDYENY